MRWKNTENLPDYRPGVRPADGKIQRICKFPRIGRKAKDTSTLRVNLAQRAELDCLLRRYRNP